MSDGVIEGQDAPAAPEETAEVVPNSPEVEALGMGMPGVTDQPAQVDSIHAMFMHHPPEGDQALFYAAIRNAAENFARVIETYAPASADRSAAIRKVREAMFTANAAIALAGKI